MCLRWMNHNNYLFLLILCKLDPKYKSFVIAWLVLSDFSIQNQKSNKSIDLHQFMKIDKMEFYKDQLYIDLKLVIHVQMSNVGHYNSSNMYV
jgi:predicted component of type VI protein secretion system